MCIVFPGAWRSTVLRTLCQSLFGEFRIRGVSMLCTLAGDLFDPTWILEPDVP
jgi:hypothetical protein